MAEIKNGAVTITGLDAFEKKIEQLKTTNPGFEKRLREVIRKVLKEARNELSNQAKDGLGMKSDPRQAYKAVRYAVYKRIFGGQVNILQSRKAHSPNSYEPPRTLQPTKRGGNRRPRSKRTDNVIHYNGLDRGFILRFLNNGMTKTNPRVIDFTANDRRKVDKWNKHPNTGNRGAIAPRNWFGHKSLEEFQSITHSMQQIIDEVINDEFV